MEYRFRRKDSSYCWVNDEQRLIADIDGNPLEIVGSWSDITARKAAEEEKAKPCPAITIVEPARPP